MNTATPSRARVNVALLQLQTPAEGAGAGAGEAAAAAAAGALLVAGPVLSNGIAVTAVGAKAVQSPGVTLSASQPMEKAVRFAAAK